jgi:hypothetical protein
MHDAEEGGVAVPADRPSTEPDVSGSEPSTTTTTTTTDDRLERLLRTLVWVGNQDVARALRNLLPAEVMLQPLPIRTALQALRKKHDPVAFLTQNQYRSTIPLVAEAVSDACQDALIAALGEAADHPDRDQLLAAIGEIREDFPVSMIALVLAFVAITDMEAADLCNEILHSEEMFEIPASVATPAL